MLPAGASGGVGGEVGAVDRLPTVFAGGVGSGAQALQSTVDVVEHLGGPRQLGLVPLFHKGTVPRPSARPCPCGRCRTTRVEPSRAVPSRAEPSRPSRAEPSRAEYGFSTCTRSGTTPDRTHGACLRPPAKSMRKSRAPVRLLIDVLDAGGSREARDASRRCRPPGSGSAAVAPSVPPGSGRSIRRYEPR